MAIEKVKAYFEALGRGQDVLEFETKQGEGCVLIVAAGDARIDNRKFKDAFGMKAKMLTPEEVLEMTGHAVGGVCPFAVENPQVETVLDCSLKRFESVYPACGSSNSAIELTCEELFSYAKATRWVDVCKDWAE